MRSLWLLWWLCCSFSNLTNAILVSGNGTADPVVSQESNQRSAVYHGYYPDDPHGIYDTAEHEHHSYDPGYYPHPPPHHYHHDGLRALLIPLAGVALLGAAAVFASNPILLQLGVVSGRRRRRELDEQPFQDIRLLRSVFEQLPKDEVARQERRLLAGYITCAGQGAGCVERLACESHNPATPVTPAERQVVDLFISQVINNEFIDKGVKKDIVRARKVGLVGGDCRSFSCPELDAANKVV